MGKAAKQTRENRTVTVDFRDEATYFQLLGDGKAFLECILAFLLAFGFQLKHKAICHGGGCLTRHSHYVRIRLGGVTIWRIQCTTCRAVFTVLPQKQLPRSLRRNPLPVKRINGSLLMGHEHLAGALVELMQSRETSSG